MAPWPAIVGARLNGAPVRETRNKRDEEGEGYTADTMEVFVTPGKDSVEIGNERKRTGEREIRR